ncbi:MAG TPA: hypothetical protein VF601_06440 [Beijerinckiaceae bacterium]|jgi:hypothetical protein
MRAAVHKALALAAALILVALGPAAAQPGKAPRQDDPLTYFYKDPRPERLVGFLEAYEASHGHWNAYPPVAGLFAVVFQKHPDWIDRLAPARFGPKVATTLFAALRLSGQGARAQALRPRLAEAGLEPKLQAEFSGLPARLDDLEVVTPTHMDILWGASFASGDGRHARKLMDFFARTANRSEAVAQDVARTVLAMTGGPKEVFGELRGRYGDGGAREIAYAATALWAVTSNARQHPFVDRAVAAYMREHPGTPATKALNVVRPRPQGQQRTEWRFIAAAAAA